jgi:AraC-like DNA-binding protein
MMLKPRAPRPPAVLIPIMTRVFEELRVGAALYQLGQWPLVIHEAPSLLVYEIAHGVVDDRYAYNNRCLEHTRRRGVTIQGRHSGFSDLFVPVGAGRDRPVLVTGPFATARLTSADILERWRSLTGRQGHPSDPEFSQYLATALETLTLDTEHLSAFRSWLEHLTELMAGQSEPRSAVDLPLLEKTISQVRSAERTFDAMRDMIDPRTTRVWSSPASSARVKSMGLAGFPEVVAVGLFGPRMPDADPVDDLVRRDSFQRAALAFAIKMGNAICGRISDHGVVFAVGPHRSKDQSRRRVREIAERAAALAKSRFGLRLHMGTAARLDSLPEQYQEAMSAAQRALARGLPSIAMENGTPVTISLTRLQRELATLVEGDPRALAATFDRYLEAVTARTGSMLEPTRGHLEVAFDAMMDALAETSTLGPNALTSLERGVKSAACNVGTVQELAAVYRQAVRDIIGAGLDPTRSNHRRSLRRAEEYMRQHFAEPLSLKRVAKVGGFAPNYFSELFRKELGVTFGARLAAFRVERAKQLLADTPLTFARVARLSGLSTPQYLSRVFKRLTGETPKACRLRGVKRRKPWQ